MIVLHSRVLVSIAIAIMAATPLAAQSAHPTSFDFTIGASEGWGGHYFSREGAAIELTLVPGHEAARIAAFTLGFRGSPASGDICAFDDGPGTRCLPRFPPVVHVGLLGGLEQRFPGGALRAMIGPAFFTGSRIVGPGGQLQFDAAAGFSHVAFVGAVRGSLIANFIGEPVRLGSFAFGLRLQ